MCCQYSYIIFLFVFSTVYGQQKTISGYIKNKEENPVSYANLIIQESGNPSKILSYGYSDDQGKFELKIPESVQEITINVTAIGYQEKWFKLSYDPEKPVVIFLEESVTGLNEVVLKARKHTDTVSVDIHDMNLNKDSKLREMLEKTDGVIIGEEGGITFQGKQINKILINGKEVFINQNTIALDNLNYEIMENVQIINNYKDKFTIDFNRIKEPVINIDTKEEFKGVLKAQVEAGYGYKNKYGLNAKGFFFSDKLNAFLTSNTNNTGEKELSFKDVSSSITTNGSRTLNNELYPFFIEDYRTQKYFVTHNSLTVRRQGNNSKTGAIIYYGNIEAKRLTDNITFVADSLLRKSNRQNSENGFFIAATINHSHIISSKAALQNVTSIMGLKRKRQLKEIDTLFIPSITSFYGNTNSISRNLTFSNDLKITQLLSNNKALVFGADYYHEQNKNDLDASVKDINQEDIIQDIKYNKDLLSIYGKLQTRFRKATLNSGITLNKTNEIGELLSLNSEESDSKIERTVSSAEIPLSLNGSYKKLDYNFSVSPILLHTKKSGNRGFFKMQPQLTYNFAQQNNLSLEFERDYKFFDVNQFLDTIVRSYNYKIINNRNISDRFSKKEDIALSWFNNNVPRGRSHHIIYRYTLEHDFLQNILDSVSDNTLYYSNKFFDRSQSHSLNTGFIKTFYIGSAYNIFQVGGYLNYTRNKYDTQLQKEYTQLKSDLWEPSIKLALRPRKFFIKEINNLTTWSFLSYRISDKKISQQRTTTNMLTAKGHSKKTTWTVDLDYTVYNVDGDKFNIFDSNFSFKYDLSNSLSLSLIGKSLLTLFEISNYNFVTTLSDGNTVTQQRTANNLGYLMLYTSFKF